MAPSPSHDDAAALRLAEQPLDDLVDQVLLLVLLVLLLMGMGVVMLLLLLMVLSARSMMLTAWMRCTAPEINVYPACVLLARVMQT